MNISNEKTGRPVTDSKNDDLSTRKHRQLVGSIGFLLPILLWLVASWRSAEENRWAPLGSISAYYYTGAVSVFAGMLFAMALFLFSYRGYGNRFYRRDRWAADIAGVAAILVALFPTGAPNELMILPWWTPGTGTIHLLAAAVLFGSFIFISVFQFPMSSVENKKDLPRDKKVRNTIYYACGAAMALCMVWVVYAISTGKSIFLPEALALEFFALSWLVKGRADSAIVEAGKSSLYYARHPQKLVEKVRTAVNSQQAA